MPANSRQVDSGAAGTATTISAGSASRSACMAANMLAPVASPSSTRITVFLSGHVDGRPTATVGGLAPNQFAAFAFGDIAQLLGRSPQSAQHVVVDNDASVTGQCTHRDLFVSGRTELAHDERIQRSAEGRGHLPCDGYSAAGQTQNYHVFPSPVCAKQTGQDAACLTSVTEDATWRAFDQASRTSHSRAPSN